MPNHIKYFEWTWLASILLGIIVAVLTYDEVARNSSPVSIGIIQFLVLVFVTTLVLLISRGVVFASILNPFIPSGHFNHSLGLLPY